MDEIIKRLGVGLVCIAVASALLLVMDASLPVPDGLRLAIDPSPQGELRGEKPAVDVSAGTLTEDEPVVEPPPPIPPKQKKKPAPAKADGKLSPVPPPVVEKEKKKPDEAGTLPPHPSAVLSLPSSLSGNPEKPARKPEPVKPQEPKEEEKPKALATVPPAPSAVLALPGGPLATIPPHASSVLSLPELPRPRPGKPAQLSSPQKQADPPTVTSAKEDEPESPLKGRLLRLHAIAFVDAPSVRELWSSLQKEAAALARQHKAAVAARIEFADHDIDKVRDLLRARTDADLRILFSTPVLREATELGVDDAVFCYVENPGIIDTGIEGGVRLPGTFEPANFAEACSGVRLIKPEALTIGTLFSQGDPHSENHVKALRRAAGGLKLIAIPTEAGRVGEDSHRLCRMGAEVIVQVPDYVASGELDELIRMATGEKVPVVSFGLNDAERGASVAVARDYESAGKRTARLAIQVLSGEKPTGVGRFWPVEDVRIRLNPEAIGKSGGRLPESLLMRAERVVR